MPDSLHRPARSPSFTSGWNAGQRHFVEEGDEAGRSSLLRERGMTVLAREGKNAERPSSACERGNAGRPFLIRTEGNKAERVSMLRRRNTSGSCLIGKDECASTVREGRKAERHVLIRERPNAKHVEHKLQCKTPSATPPKKCRGGSPASHPRQRFKVHHTF